MASLPDAVKRALANKASVTRLVGTYVGSTDGVTAIVDVGGGRIPADFCGHLPAVNDTVWILFIDGTATLLGPTLMAGLTAGPISPLAPPDPAGGAVVDRSHIFTPIDSGSYRAGNWWSDDVYAQSGQTGAWFYGTKINDTIPDTATILSIELFIVNDDPIQGTPNIGYHSYPTKVDGVNVNVSGAPAVPIIFGWSSLPTYYGDYLKATSGGIGIDGNSMGTTICKSSRKDGSSGALRIYWRS